MVLIIIFYFTVHDRTIEWCSNKRKLDDKTYEQPAYKEGVCKEGACKEGANNKRRCISDLNKVTPTQFRDFFSKHTTTIKTITKMLKQSSAFYMVCERNGIVSSWIPVRIIVDAGVQHEPSTDAQMYMSLQDVFKQQETLQKEEYQVVKKAIYDLIINWILTIVQHSNPTPSGDYTQDSIIATIVEYFPDLHPCLLGSSRDVVDEVQTPGSTITSISTVSSQLPTSQFASFRLDEQHTFEFPSTFSSSAHSSSYAPSFSSSLRIEIPTDQQRIPSPLLTLSPTFKETDNTFSFGNLDYASADDFFNMNFPLPNPTSHTDTDSSSFNPMVDNPMLDNRMA